MDKIAPYYKAVAGFVVPFLTTIGSSLLESSDGGTAITASEWIAATVISLTTGGVVFGVENKPATGYVGRARDENGDGIPDRLQ